MRINSFISLADIEMMELFGILCLMKKKDGRFNIEIHLNNNIRFIHCFRFRLFAVNWLNEIMKMW